MVMGRMRPMVAMMTMGRIALVVPQQQGGAQDVLSGP